MQRDTSRHTWTIDGEFWLSHADVDEATPFQREAELLRALPGEIDRCGAAWGVPDIVLADDGRTTAVSADGVWRVTRHLAGDHPEPRDPATYRVLPSMLAELHAVLESSSPARRVREEGIVERAAGLLALYGTRSFAPVTGDPLETFAVRTTADWLATRVHELAAQPRQLTHGDWIPTNVKIGATGWGVLDWEFCRVDPVVMDLAQSCCTLLIWSGLDRVEDRIDELVRRYSVDSGKTLSPESVRAAMMLYWLHNYHHWRERHEAVGRYENVLARQPGRLLAVGKFVGALHPSDLDGAV
jgi:Ser/Thr protein kinase RdoA (MazF antagonist)